MKLRSGAELRIAGPTGAHLAVVCVNGGQAAEVAGTWSASLEWLVTRLAPRFRELAFAEVRYRIKSLNRLDWCAEDALAAINSVGAERTLLLGFSMGGAIAALVANEPSVETVVALAPWLPNRVSLDALRGRRLVVLHGSLDRPLPGIPGVLPASSRRAFERARALGAEGTYTIIPGALHGVAIRAHWGRAIPLPRAGAWLRLVADELQRFQAG